MQLMIVGVDPGTTVGLAFLDLDGQIMDIESGKNISVPDIIFEISEHGDLLILASDRKPLPATLKKIAANFSCKVYAPPKPLSVSEKNELVRGCEFRNQHEADALAAALKAYKFFSGKLRQLRRRYGDAGVKSAFLGKKPKPEKEIVRKEIVYVEKHAKKIAELHAQIKNLKESMEGRDKIIAALQARISELEHRPGPKPGQILAAKERTIQSLSAKNRELEEQLERFAKALHEKKIKWLDLGKSAAALTNEKKRTKTPILTQDPTVFEWFVENDQSCTLIDLLYRAGPIIFYTIIKEYESKGSWLEELVEKHRHGKGINIRKL